jgi:hypothetical protein
MTFLSWVLVGEDRRQGGMTPSEALIPEIAKSCDRMGPPFVSDASTIDLDLKAPGEGVAFNANTPSLTEPPCHS